MQYKSFAFQFLFGLIAISGLSTALGQSDQQSPDALWTAARKGELKTVEELIGGGIDVNAPTDYGATALSFAADRGHEDVVQFLLKSGADPNVKDSFYKATPMTWAVSGNHLGIIKALVDAGATDVDRALTKAIAVNDIELVRHIAQSGHASRQAIRSNLDKAKASKKTELAEILRSAYKKQFPAIEITPEQLEAFAGAYRSDSKQVLRVALTDDNQLRLTNDNGQSAILYADSKRSFSSASAKYTFEQEADSVTALIQSRAGTETLFARLSEEEASNLPKAKPSEAPEVEEASGDFPASSPESLAADLEISGPNWAQFRGNGARGIADGQRPPLTWNAEEKENLAWMTPIPGLGHSCPVVWEDRVYLTSAVSEKDTSIKTGLYGDVASVDDDSEHEFVTICLDAASGKVIWQKTACTKVPSVKRHLKSTHANSTIATDGKHVVSWFGSEGVYCYTMDGTLVWEKQLGLLDSGWFYDREYQWQFGASPIIHDGYLVLQCDIQDQSFIAAYDIETGNEIWKTLREEIPSWSTPTVVRTPGGVQIITNATKAARAYDFRTGKEIWRIQGNSEIAVPTPFSARGLIYVSSGYRPIQPIYAIRPDAEGDLTLPSGKEDSEFIAWSKSRGGPYMLSPLLYGDYLYICSNSGILTCYQATTGEVVYKKRLPMKTLRSFVGSPIAADGSVFFTNEEGETLIVKAGPKFEVVANCFSGETCLTTPAIAQGTFFLRGQQHLFAFRQTDDSQQ